MNVTRNNIKSGDKVFWSSTSLSAPQQNGLASGVLVKGEIYTVSFVFAGDEFEQIELDGVDQLFAHDMFTLVPDSLANKLAKK